MEKLNQIADMLDDYLSNELIRNFSFLDVVISIIQTFLCFSALSYQAFTSYLLIVAVSVPYLLWRISRHNIHFEQSETYKIKKLMFLKFLFWFWIPLCLSSVVVLFGVFIVYEGFSFSNLLPFSFSSPWNPSDYEPYEIVGSNEAIVSWIKDTWVLKWMEFHRYEKPMTGSVLYVIITVKVMFTSIITLLMSLFLVPYFCRFEKNIISIEKRSLISNAGIVVILTMFVLVLVYSASLLGFYYDFLMEPKTIKAKGGLLRLKYPVDIGLGRKVDFVQLNPNEAKVALIHSPINLQISLMCMLALVWMIPMHIGRIMNLFKRKRV